MLLDNFLVAVNAVVPMFIIIGIGYFLGRKGMLDSSTIKKINKILFDVVAPLLLFSNLYGSNFRDAFDIKFILFLIAVQIGLFIIFFVIFGIYKKDNPKECGAMIQGVCRSNILIMGIPLATNLLGEGNIALTTVAIAFFSPVQTICNIIALERYRGGKVTVSSMIKSVIKNPFIIGTIVGVIFSVFHITLPSMIYSPIKSLSSMFSPLALLTLGASLDLKSAKEKMKETIICTISKLVVYPAFSITLAALLGFRGDEIVTVLVLFGSSTAVMTFTMAQQMNSDSDLAGSIVVVSSFMSCFTILASIIITKSLGLF